RVERIRIDQGRITLGGGKTLRADRDCILGPLYRKLSVQLRNPLVTARIAEEDNVVFGQVGFGHVLVVLDERMASEELRPHAVEARESAQRLLIHLVIPGCAGGTNQQERVEKRVVNRALQRMSLVEAEWAAVSVHLPGCPNAGKRDFGSGLHLEI